MPFFKKKPIVIEAMKFDASTYKDIITWVRSYGGSASTGTQIAFCTPESPEGSEYPTIIIDTLEGAHTASLGDWIIKGIKDEFYPCKPDVFEATYELVD